MKRRQLTLLGSTPARRKAAQPRKAVRETKHFPLIRLSPTTGLNLFRECPRCFYLHHAKGVHRPRGIFPSLPSGMDLVIKEYYDGYRGKLPPELQDRVSGVLVPDQALLSRWRNWRTGMEYHDPKLNATLFGALDDCLIDQGLYIPLDYKTKGSAPGEGDGERYYQLQLDTYTLLLQQNGFPVAGHAFLVYYYPKTVGMHGDVTFHVLPVRVATDPDRARRMFEQAVTLLHGGAVPPHHTRCEYCLWNEHLQEFD